MVWVRRRFYSHKLEHWFRPTENLAHWSTAFSSMPFQRMAMRQCPWGICRLLIFQKHRHFVEYRRRAGRQWLPTIEWYPIAMGNKIGSLTLFSSVIFPEYSVRTNHRIYIQIFVQMIQIMLVNKLKIQNYLFHSFGLFIFIFVVTASHILCFNVFGYYKFKV